MPNCHINSMETLDGYLFKGHFWDSEVSQLPLEFRPQIVAILCIPLEQTKTLYLLTSSHHTFLSCLLIISTSITVYNIWSNLHHICIPSNHLSLTFPIITWLTGSNPDNSLHILSFFQPKHSSDHVQLDPSNFNSSARSFYQDNASHTTYILCRSVSG